MGSSALLLKGGVSQPKSVVETYAISNTFAPGQVVRYNGSSWVLAQANTAENSEVVGVVSTASSGSFDVTYSGFIASAVSASTAPVLFLSADTAGALSTTPPSVIGSVVKPILTKTSSGWLVNNYLGTQIGGSSTISVDQIQPVGSIMPFAGSSIPDTWLTCDGTAYAISSYGELYSALQNSTGSRAPLHGYVAVLTVAATTGFSVGQTVTQTLPAGTVLSGTVIAIGTSPVTLTIQTIPTYSSTTKNFSYPNAIFTSGLTVTNGTNSPNVTAVSVTKFNTPNLRGRFAVGENLTAIPDSETDGTFSSLVNTYGLGAVGGQESTVAGTGTATGTNAFVTSAATTGGLISNIPPYVATKYIIKAKPYTRAAIIDGIDIPYSNLLVTDLRSGLLRGAGVGDDLLFKTNNSLTDYGTERMRLTSGGSLGIGTQTPVKLLDVAGTINATGAITSASVAATGAITSASLAATGAITSASLVATGAITSASLVATGAITSASLAATGKITSGTTTLNNLPPTENNDLCRKDYVDTATAGSKYTFVTQTPIATDIESNKATEVLAPFIQIPSSLIPTSARIVRLLVHLHTGQGPSVLYSSTAYGTTTPTSSNIISSRRCHGVSALSSGDNAGSQAFFEMPLMRHNNITVGSNQNYIKFFMPNSCAFPDIGGVMIDGYWS